MRLTVPVSISLSKERLACIGLFFYLIKSPVRAAMARLLHLPGLVNIWVSIALMYLPLLLIPLVQGKKRKIVDFCLIWLFVFLSCMATYLFHPEYKEWLFQGDFDIWRYIFRPDQAIYLYLFIRLADDPKKIFKTLKWAAFLLFAYNLAKFIYSELIVGYWEGTGVNRGAEGEYNLGFGYEVLFLFVVFSVLGRKESKWYYVLSAISLLCILIAGSRGPLVGVGLVLLIILLDRIKTRPLSYRIILFILFFTVAVFAIYYFAEILTRSALLLQRIGISSRTIEKILSGEIMDGSGRAKLYQIALDLIRTGGPFGNGIYGDRYVISAQTTMWIGYCHQIVLEILVDYGYALGGVFVALIIWQIIRILRSPRSEWRDLYIIFLITASQLLLSGSYLYSSVFWGCLATGACWSEQYGIRTLAGLEKVSLKYGM